MDTTYELKEIRREPRIINFLWDNINLNNLSSKMITNRLFWKKTLILNLKSGEKLVYDWVTEEEINRLFKA
jgi:hypothetical protein